MTSILYCTIPHFAAALARRDDPALACDPLILVGPDGRVFGASAEAACCGVIAGMAARTAEIRCPGARLLEADVARCRRELDVLLELLEGASPAVEPRGWGAAYVDLGPLARTSAEAIPICGQLGNAVRHELGLPLQPALGWDSTKFTAQAAACLARPGRLRAVATLEERAFLRPLPVLLLPLAADALLRLQFLGLRTLGQYADLPPAAVWQQFGPAGRLAHRCARGEDNRPVIPRRQQAPLVATIEFEAPLARREGLEAALDHLASPLLADLQRTLRACGRVRLSVEFDDGSAVEEGRSFLLPTAGRDGILRTLGELLDHMAHSRQPDRVGGIAALSVTLDQIEDALPRQLSLFPLQDERQARLQQAQRYLASRFGTPRLRRAVLAQPGAPLPEWRVTWHDAVPP